MFFTYTAQEAYDASLDNYEEKLEKNRLEIDNLIQKAIKQGEFSIVYDKQAASNVYTNTTKQILNQLGYKVTEKINKENKKIWIISWETPGEINENE